jgi:hypothetical protein
VVTLSTEVLCLSWAAFVLSLQVRQQFGNPEHGAPDQDRFLYYRLFVCFLSAWKLAREWLLHPFFIRPIGGTHAVNIAFAMRWLYPVPEMPGFVGFLVDREWGFLPKPGGRRAVRVQEGRISLQFVSSSSTPPIFSTVILQDCPIGNSNLGPKLFQYRPHRLRVIGESSISSLQLVLDNLLEATWYRGWMSFLDEVDDSVKVQVSKVSASAHILVEV